MPKPDPLQVLNDLLIILDRSLAMYVSQATPWVGPADERARQTLENLVTDQKFYVDRIGDILVKHRYVYDLGEFPMTYTDLHDLALDYLLKEITRYHRRDIQAIERCVQKLAGAGEAETLAQEVLGNAKGHLEVLESLGPAVAAK